jgi:choloylglycine hydrolase
LEIVDGVPHFYENTVGVITNAPGFEWHLTNLSNYVNLYGGNAVAHKMGDFEVKPIGSGSGLRGVPGDATPPSRFIRAAFIRNTAPQLADATATVMQTFHLLNFFDVPLGFEINAGEQFPDIPSATQWTSSIDLTHRKVYYHTAYNVNIRCIDLSAIDFGKVTYQWHPLDASQVQPVEMVEVK